MLGSLKWIAATVLACLVAVVCAGGWLRTVWLEHARIEAAVSARDAEWTAKLAAQSARADAAEAAVAEHSARAAEAERQAQQASAMAADEAEHAALVDLALAALDADPIVFPKALVREMRR